MAKFETQNGDLYIDGKKIIKAWESFTGWSWFGVNVLYTQDSDLGNGKVIKDDKIWYGFVQGLEEEWGNFSQREIESLAPKVWPIPRRNLSHSGRRS